MSKIPSQFLFLISGSIDLNIPTFLFTKSMRVSFGFWLAPAVIIIRPQSVKSSYEPA